jgi:hypothetical protein
MSSAGREEREAVVDVGEADGATVCVPAAAAAAVGRDEGEVTCVGERPLSDSRRGLGKGEAKRAVELESLGGSGSVRDEGCTSRRPAVMVGRATRARGRRETDDASAEPTALGA